MAGHMSLKVVQYYINLINFYSNRMNKIIKITLIIIGVLLLGNGLLNIVDDGTVLTYDIASILSGIGFILVVVYKK